MPDPKDRLAEYRLYERAQALLYDRRLDEAAAVFRQILARDPGNTLARRDLGGLMSSSTYMPRCALASRR